MSQKSRFCELSTEEIYQIMDKAVPETTKKATKFRMRLFNFPLKFEKFQHTTVETLRVKTTFTLILQWYRIFKTNRRS